MPRVSKTPSTLSSFPAVPYPLDSEGRPRVPDAEPSSPEIPRSETRIATRAAISAAVTDEAWANDLSGAPMVTMSLEQIRSLPLDHRAGFLLSLMDGTMDLETVIELSEMPRPDALRIARALFDDGVLAFS